MELDVARNVSLQEYNSLATPAIADAFYALPDPSRLEPALAWARANDLGVIVLGEGSNVVLADRIPGLVLTLQNRGQVIEREDANQASIAVAAGSNWHRFVGWCLENRFYGLENLALIPGSVGAAPIQNIGAYGVEAGRFIDEVRCRDLESGKSLTLDREACRFAYRDSIFKRELRDRVLIEAVVFSLPKSFAPVLDYPSLADYLLEHGISQPGARELYDAVVAIRSQRLPNPAQVPNAGSFFKNPLLDAVALEALESKLPGLPRYPRGDGLYAVPAAFLIEASGIPARLCGPVTLHPQHALVIINPMRAGAREIRATAATIREAVSARFGIALEQEPRDYG